MTFLDKELYRNENKEVLTSFFKKIGVNNFNPCAVIDSYILMEFDNFTNKRGDVKEEDLFSYTNYVFKNYINDTKILDKSRQKIPLKTKDNKWILPTKIYFSSQYFHETSPSHYLEEIFLLIKNINFLDSEYLTKLKFNEKINLDEIIKFFGHLGVEDKPRIYAVIINKDNFSRYKDKYKTIIKEEMEKSRIYRNWSNIPFFEIDKCFDYKSNDINAFLEIDLEETKKEELYKKLILLLDSKWNYYQKHQIKLIGKYWTSNSCVYLKEIPIRTNSIIESLLESNWIPSTGGFKCAKQVFYNGDGLQLIHNQPYLLNVELKNEHFINTFFLKEDIKDVILAISTIKDLKLDFKSKLEKLIHILKFLSKKELKDDLKDKEIILVDQGYEKWYSINKVLWNYREQNIKIFGGRGYISDKYPDDLFNLFKSLGMRDGYDIEDYLERLNELKDFSKEGLNDIEFKKIRDIIYGIIDNLLDNEQNIENQIENFKKFGVVYFNDGKFRKLNTKVKIFFNDNTKLYDKFEQVHVNFKQYFIEGDYKKFQKFFKKLGLYSFSDSVEKKLVEESVKYFPIENDFFDLKNIGKYLIDVFKNFHKNRKLTDIHLQKISELASIEVKYADSIPIKYYIKQLENFTIITEENYFYRTESKMIFIKKSKEKHKKIIGIAKGLSDFFAISQTYAPFFEYIIENSNNIKKIEEYLEAHEIDLEKGEEAKSKTPTNKETGGDETGGDETGGDETGGDETGGDETGGDETGGDETGGDETGGDETGGDETGGDETGGDETGGDETGGDETGGDETGGDETGGSDAFTFEELLEKCKNPPPDTEENRPEKMFESLRRQRNAELGKAVKQVYEDKCAVCGLITYDLKGNPEAQWAHIKPARKPHNGPDDIRNGLALCRFHHWAFDKGLFALSDDYNIIVKESYPENGDYEKITEFKGKKIFIPSEILKPHIKFLKYHRDMYGF